jgi:nucleoside phosphorylase
MNPTSGSGSSAASRARLLIVAAMRDEVAGLLGRLGRTRGGAERWGHCHVHFGRLAGTDVAVAWTGEGAELAARGLAAVLGNVPITRVLGLGVAGGLSPGLEPGDLIVGSRVQQGSQPAAAGDEKWADRALALGGVLSGTVLTTRRVLCTAAEKAAAWTGMLGSTANAVVDLETAVWARVAAEHGVPFLAARAVCDTAREDLPLDLNACLDADGKVNRLKVARRALFQPSAMRELWDLRARVKLCERRLAEFAERLIRADEPQALPPGGAR